MYGASDMSGARWKLITKQIRENPITGGNIHRADAEACEVLPPVFMKGQKSRYDTEAKENLSCKTAVMMLAKSGKGRMQGMEQYFEIVGTTLNIKLPSEVDHHSSEEIRKGADRILQRRLIRSVVFDFEKTAFMDSSGIGMIMGRYKTMRFMGGNVVAVHVNERMQRILTLSGIYKLIDIYDGMPQN